MALCPSFFFLLAAHLQAELILFSGGQASANMAFRFVDIQNFSSLLGKEGVDRD